MLDLVKDLVPLLGSRKENAFRHKVDSLLRAPPQADSCGPMTYWNYPKEGISLLFAGPRLVTIFLGPILLGGAFSGSLPKGLSFQSRRRQVHAALGAPASTLPGGPEYCEDCPEKTHLIAVNPIRDRYNFATYSILFEFGGERASEGSRERPARKLPISQVVVSETGFDPTVKDPPAAKVRVTNREINVAFFCAACRKPAGDVRLELREASTRPAPAGPSLFLDFGTGSESASIGPEKLPGLRRALEGGDAGALHTINGCWAASFCPPCKACYCRDHWYREEGPPSWGSSYSWDWVEFGACPQGHRRIIREL